MSLATLLLSATLRLVSWNPDTEEAEIMFLSESGVPKCSGLIVVREESLANELVRRWNAHAPK